jgi:riboflavin kinase / FMN adenylyltransferase
MPPAKTAKPKTKNLQLITGVVVRGRQEGRKIGFPTANQQPNEYSKKLLETLEYGIYATRTSYQDVVYNSITNYGTAPAYNFDKVVFETYIFDFDSEIYGDEITVEIVEFLRPVMDFDSLDGLVEQIKKDCERAREVLG